MHIRIGMLARSTTFWVTLVLFLILNVWSFVRHLLFPVCCDQDTAVGFPFPFLISGGIAGNSAFYLLGAALDLILALTVALVTTWIALACGNSAPRP